MVCVVIVDRFVGDQPRGQSSEEELKMYTSRPYDLLIQYLQGVSKL